MFLTSKHSILLLLASIIHYTNQEAPIQCQHVPELSVLPGFGLDALTGDDTKRISTLTYNQCKLTDDGNNRIPDNVETEKLNTTKLTTTVIKNWLNYTPPTAPGTRETDHLYYTFSDDYQEMKNLQIKHRAFTCRSQLTRATSRLHLLSRSITTSLKARFAHVVRALEQNRNKKAKYLVQTIIRDYGTHYTTSVDVGKMLTKEDYLRNEFLLRRVDRDELVMESKLSLLETVRRMWGDELELNSTLLSEYNDAIVHTKLTLTSSIDCTVELLTNLITKSNFPNTPILMELRNLVDDSIRNYFRVNRHPGCTRAESPNFDYAANVDDGSCRPATSFGGVFQDCVKEDCLNFKRTVLKQPPFLNSEDVVESEEYDDYKVDFIVKSNAATEYFGIAHFLVILVSFLIHEIVCG